MTTTHDANDDANVDANIIVKSIEHLLSEYLETILPMSL